METEMRQVMKKLEDIKAELNYIKEHMVDVDMVLTDDDRKALREAEEDLREGKTISHEKLKKELGL